MAATNIDPKTKPRSLFIPGALACVFATGLAAVSTPLNGTSATSRVKRGVLESIHRYLPEPVSRRFEAAATVSLDDILNISTGTFSRVEKEGALQEASTDKNLSKIFDRSEHSKEYLKWALSKEGKAFLESLGISLSLETPGEQKLFLDQYKNARFFSLEQLKSNKCLPLPTFQGLQDLEDVWYPANRGSLITLIKESPATYPILTSLDLEEDAIPLHLQVREEKLAGLLAELNTVKEALEKLKQEQQEGESPLLANRSLNLAEPGNIK